MFKFRSGIFFALIPSLVTGGILGQVPRATAQSVLVPFNANINGDCAFILNQVGVLGLSNDGRTFDSQIAGGQSAQLTLDCNLIGIQLQVEQPEQALPSNYSLTDSPYNGDVSAVVNYQTFFFGFPACADTLTINDSSPSDLSGCALFSLGENEITVNMKVTSDVVIPGGSYSYRVKLTAVP